jgi:cell division protein FtsA
MSNGPVYALDLGSSEVKLLCAERNEQGEMTVLESTSVKSDGIVRGMITNFDAVVANISTAVRSLHTVPRPGEVTVSVNGTHLEGIPTQGVTMVSPPGRAVSRGDVLSVINHSRQISPGPDREQIMALPREFRVDGNKVSQSPVGINGNKLEVISHVITAGLPQINTIERAVTSAGLDMTAMVAAPLASGLGILTPEERNLGAAVIDIGATCTTISVFSDGSLAYFAVIPLGGNTVTNDLSKLIQTSMEEAESLKIQYGRAIPPPKSDETTVEVRQIGQNHPRNLQRRVFCEIIESRMREIAHFALQHIERSGLAGMLPGGILMTGGGSQLISTPALFAQVFGETNVRLGAPKVRNGLSESPLSPRWSATVGMAKYAFEDEAADFVPASGFESWKEKFFNLFQLKV